MPATATIECGGEKVTYEYTGRNNIWGIDASDAWFYFSNVGIDIYDYRIVAGTQLETLGAPAIPTDIGMPGIEEDEDEDDKKTDKKDEASKESETVAPEKTEKVEEKKSGCGSSVAVMSSALVGAVGASAVIVSKKKKED